MINKELDTSFIHFDIRKHDMEIIENLYSIQGLVSKNFKKILRVLE